MTDLKLAVLGNPIEHSRSPEIHQMFARQCGLSISYERLLVPEGEFDAVAAKFLQRGLGFNVTLPCKTDAWQFVEQASDHASLAQAVNTVSRTSTGSLRGDNTDGPGLVSDIQQNLGWQLSGRKVLVLGAGGAVAGVLPSLLASQPELLHLHNRTHEKAEALVERMGLEHVTALRRGDLLKGYDIVINGTSAGLSGRAPDLPEQIINERSGCYDMVYNNAGTAFTRWCLDRANCQVSDGLGMLIEQAALSFEIWFQQKVDTGPVIASMRNG